MHRTEIPDWAVSRAMARRGKAHVFDSLVANRAALVVIDLQNGFMADGAYGLVPAAREIVPNVNRIASALREAGGTVVWVRHTVTDETISDWSVFHDDLSLPGIREQRILSMRDGHAGHRLWSDLAVEPGDPVINKTRYSAFIQGSSNIEELLMGRGIDTVLITGTVTSVCCESSARDAMMRNFKTVMVSDANAARTDEEHNASLTAFYVTFGDVMSTEEVLGCLAGKRPAASAAE